MMNDELKNLEKMVPLSFFANSSLLSSLIDVASKQIVFLNIIKEWSFTFLTPFNEIAINDVNNAPNS